MQIKTQGTLRFLLTIASELCATRLQFIGRKGIEPSTALAIEFTAQPIIPTNGTFL
jgi:hypothetical protein